MRRHASILIAYFLQFVKARLVYRADFIVDSLSVFGALAVQLAFLGVLYSRIQTLAGWSIDELILIHGFSMIPLGLFNLISFNLWNFSEKHLVEGQFDRVLLRPIHPVFQVLFETFNVAALNEIIIGCVLLVVAGTRLGIAPEAGDLLLLPLLAVSGAAIYLGIFLTLTSLSFWFEDRLGIGAPVYNMIRFARYPVTIYHPAVRALLSWIIPFSFAAFYPATAFLRSTEFQLFVWLTPVVAVISLSVALFVFSRGMLRYTSTGS
ncbi:MAG: membrane protein [Gemmatimonadota bacterium]|nr:MAG: membrane protein [Gemmatimonadota bacterium]